MRVWSMCAALALAVLAGCGSSVPDAEGGGAAAGPQPEPAPAFSGGSGPATSPPAANGCNTIRGRVYDPAGRTPLYGVAVYVPRGELPKIADGVSCSRCGVPISAYAAAMTDATGAFSLSGVPDGDTVRVVLESGKWRRELTVPGARGCKEIVLDDPKVVRLPRDASEGSLPRVAVVAGGADSLECLLRKVGVADSEFGTAGDVKAHVHLYHGANGRSRFAGGKPFAEASTLFPDGKKLDAYDAVLAACAGRVEDHRTVPPAWVSAMEAYAARGGRAFFSHYMSYFVRGGSPALSGVAAIRPDDGDDLVDPFVADVRTTFPKGKIFSEWLTAVGASTTPAKIPIRSAQYTVSSVEPSKATSWIESKNGVLQNGASVGPVVQYFTANLPAGAAEASQCGRYVVSDLHVGSDGSGTDFPTGCASKDLTPQEKVLEFMLFDLASCVQADTTPPQPPVLR